MTTSSQEVAPQHEHKFEVFWSTKDDSGHREYRAYCQCRKAYQRPISEGSGIVEMEPDG